MRQQRLAAGEAVPVGRVERLERHVVADDGRERHRHAGRLEGNGDAHSDRGGRNRLHCGGCAGCAQAAPLVSGAHERSRVRATIDRCGLPSRSSTSASATSPATRARIVGVHRRGARRRRRASSSRPSCRSAAIRPRTCCCGPISSTRAQRALRDLAAQARGARGRSPGFPEHADGASLQRGGRAARRCASPHVYRKHCLPNYTVFDEARTFTPGTEPCVVQRRRAALRRARLRGHLVARTRAPVARRRRRASCSFPTHRRITRASARCGATQVARAGARMRHPDRLRESRRRAGRARLRRRVVRHERRGRGRRSSGRRGTR